MKRIGPAILLALFCSFFILGSARAQITLPYSNSSYSGSSPAFSITNSSGAAFDGCSTSGPAGYFSILSGGAGMALEGYTQGSGDAIEGQIDNSSSSADAIYGLTNGSGAGVYGSAAGYQSVGVYGVASGSLSSGVYGSTATNGYGVQAQATGSGGFAIYSTTSGDDYAGYFNSTGTTTKGTLYGHSSGTADGIVALTDGSGVSVHAVNSYTSGQAGTFQNSDSTNVNTAPALTAYSTSKNITASGALIESDSGFTVSSGTTAPTLKVVNFTSGPLGSSNSYPVAEFDGTVNVLGSMTKGGGAFKIDHPLDPDNKYLYHSFVESPDMKNIYDGVITTDGSGIAVVTMPDYFEALNQDFRYQLTVIGGQFAQAIVSGEIQNNQFSIETNAPNIKVSWQVTGVRHDAFANAHRIQVEVDKAPGDQGKYLYPTELGKPVESGITYTAPLNQPVPEVPMAPSPAPVTLQSQPIVFRSKYPTGMVMKNHPSGQRSPSNNAQKTQ